MGTFVAFVWLFVAVALIIGLIKPSLVFTKSVPQKYRTRKWVLITYGIPFLALPFVGAMYDEGSWILATVLLFVVFVVSVGSISAKIEEEKKQKGRVSDVKIQQDVEVTDPSHQGDVHIIYQDANGELTNRDVSIDYVDDEHIEGFCHLRNARRTFKIDRIKELVDLKTGEFYDDPRMYLAKYYNTKKRKRGKKETNYTITINLDDILNDKDNFDYAKDSSWKSKEIFLEPFDESRFYDENGRFIIPRYKINKTDTLLGIRAKDYSDRRDFFSMYDKEERENFTLEMFNEDGDMFFEFEVEPTPLLSALNEKFLLHYGLADSKKSAKVLLDILKERFLEMEPYPTISADKETLQKFGFIKDFEKKDEALIEFYDRKYNKDELYAKCKEHGAGCHSKDKKRDIIQKLLDAKVLPHKEFYEVELDDAEFDRVLEKIGEAIVEEVKGVVQDWHPYAKGALFEELSLNCEVDKIKNKIE